MSEFFEMGGYATYVWSSYGLTLVVLIANVVSARAKELNVEKSLKGRIKRESRTRHS